jgi:ureidoglycolate hydrolase
MSDLHLADAEGSRFPHLRRPAVWEINAMAMTDVRRLPLDVVTHASWKPFGSLPSDEGTEHDTASLEFLWNDGHLNFIGHHRAEVPWTETGPRCEVLYRHDTHTQALMPMDDDAVIVVAPAAVDFSAPEHFDRVRAFTVPALTPVRLSRGTWHWGPYPRARDSVRLLNVQGRGYPRDNGVVRLARDHGIVFEVAVG